MAEGKPISKNDIIEPGIIQELVAELKGLSKVFSEATGKSEQNVKDTNKALKDTIEVTEDLIRLQVKDAEIKTKIEKLRLKGRDISDKERGLLKVYEEQLKRNNTQLNNEARLLGSTKGSYNELSQAMAVNKKRLRELDTTNKANRKTRDSLIKTIQKQDKTLKKFDKTIGDNQRNVGNYGSALEGVTGQFGIFGAIIPQIKGGLNLLKVGFTSLKRAIITTGIGALVVALGMLISYFTTTAEGAAKLRRIMVPLNAAWNTMITTAQELGNVLSNIFSQDILTTWNELKGVVSDVNDLYKEEIRLAGNLATINNLQHKLRVENIVKLAKLERDVANARLIANDEQNYSLEQQIAGIDLAVKKTKELYDLKITEAKLAESAAITASQQAIDDEDAELAKQQAIAAVISLEATRDNNLRTLLRRQTTLYNKQNTALKEVKTTLEEIIELDTSDIDAEIKNQQKREEIDLILKTAEAQYELTAAQEKANQQAQDAINLEDAKVDALNAAFTLGIQIAKKASTEQKLLAIAQATVNAYLAASQVLADWKTLNAVQKAAAAFATLAIGLGLVGKIKNIAEYADGTESVQGGVKGKDSVNALLMPGERVLTVEQNKQLAGISNNDIPGLVRLGQQSTMVSPELIAIAHAQLSEQRNTNNLLGKWRIVEPDGTMRNLKNDEIKHYIN